MISTAIRGPDGGTQPWTIQLWWAIYIFLYIKLLLLKITVPNLVVSCGIINYYINIGMPDFNKKSLNSIVSYLINQLSFMKKNIGSHKNKPSIPYVKISVVFNASIFTLSTLKLVTTIFEKSYQRGNCTVVASKNMQS